MKVTLDGIKAKIKGETYTVLPDGRTTVCQLTMENGFTVNGHSACVDAANFDADLGRKYSFEDAMRNIWPLEGYLLAEQIYQGAATEKPYSWTDVANYSMQADRMSLGIEFSVVMRDGWSFIGSIPAIPDSNQSMQQMIIDNVNKQVANGAKA